MSAQGASDIPPEVLAESQRLRQEGEREQQPEIEPETPDEVQPVQLSRRQQKELERQQREEALEARARKAEETAAEVARSNQEFQARVLAELTRLQQPQMTQQGATTVAPQQPEPQNYKAQADKHMRKAEEALAKNDMAEYHRRLRKANELDALAAVAPVIPQPQQFMQQIPQPQPQKPAWVTAVENQYPDVITHERGFNTVAAFVQMGGGAQGLNADKLKAAFDRAREELGLKQRKEETVQKQRQMLAGAPTNGAAKSGSAGKGATTVNVKLAKGIDFKAIAKRSGITPEQYAKAYAKMNPGDVEKD